MTLQVLQHWTVNDSAGTSELARSSLWRYVSSGQITTLRVLQHCRLNHPSNFHIHSPSSRVGQVGVQWVPCTPQFQQTPSPHPNNKRHDVTTVCSFTSFHYQVHCNRPSDSLQCHAQLFVRPSVRSSIHPSTPSTAMCGCLSVCPTPSTAICSSLLVFLQLATKICISRATLRDTQHSNFGLSKNAINWPFT
jgi:hypothetical protein